LNILLYFDVEDVNMIQRIQHFFLLLSAVATGIIILKPVISIEVPNGESGLMYASALKSAGAGEVILPSLPLVFLVSLITLISLVSIFLYKKRLLQMRLTVYNMILLVGLLGLGYFYARLGAKEISGEIKLMFFSVMPLVAFILSLLAWRGIRRDYLMIKAIDRIR